MSSVNTFAMERGLRTRIDGLSYLPTSVAVAMRFLELGKTREPDPAEYAQVVMSDASLSAKILSLANSSWFGVRNRVTRPVVAVNLLGLSTVRTFAISFCLTGLHHESRLSHDEFRNFWGASLCKAVAAKEYATLIEPSAADEAFAAATFQDFAVPIMLSVAGDAMAAVANEPASCMNQRLAREREIFNLDHAEAGRLIAQRLELPELYVDAVAFHHSAGNLRQFVNRPALAEALSMAALFPHRLGVWNLNDAESFRENYSKSAAAERMDIAAFLAKVDEEFRRLFAFFEQGSVPETKLAEVLIEASREAADNTVRLAGALQAKFSTAAVLEPPPGLT